MPASSGNVRMPAGNRQTTASSLKTNDIWSKAIGQTNKEGFGQNEVEESTGIGGRRKVPKAIEGSEEYERVRAILRSSKAGRDGQVQDDGRGRWKGKSRLKGLFAPPPMPSTSSSSNGKNGDGSQDEGEESWSDSDGSNDEDKEEGEGEGEGASKESSSSMSTTTAVVVQEKPKTREEAIQIYNVELKLLQKEQMKYKAWCEHEVRKDQRKRKKKAKKKVKRDKKKAKRDKKKAKKKAKKAKKKSSKKIVVGVR